MWWRDEYKNSVYNFYSFEETSYAANHNIYLYERELRPVSLLSLNLAFITNDRNTIVFDNNKLINWQDEKYLMCFVNLQSTRVIEVEKYI